MVEEARVTTQKSVVLFRCEAEHLLEEYWDRRHLLLDLLVYGLVEILLKA